MDLEPDMLIGVVSDTHGLIRPEVRRLLATCDHIIHAGDVGDRETLEELRSIAPLTVVRGNVDTGTWAEGLPRTEAVEVGGKSFYVVHNIHDLDIDPKGFDVVVYGHSHQPQVNKKGETMFLNPGSSGPKRFHFPVSYARVEIFDSKLVMEFKVIEFSKTD